MINVLFVSADHSMGCSGVSTVVSQLADRLAQESDTYSVRIVVVGDGSISQDPRVNIDHISQRHFCASLRWAPGLTHEIIRIVDKYEISLIHVHGIWRAANLAGLIAASKSNTPVILSSHGMLEQWLWKEQGFMKECKKRIYFNLVFKKALPHNLVVHAITSREKENLKGYFPGKRIVSIPNAINIDLENQPEGVNKAEPLETTIVFLGRLHPVKGIEVLLEAFCKANLPEKWKVQVIGPEEDLEYVNRLKVLVREKGIEDRVTFLAPIFDEEKLQLLRRAWVLVMPSYSEVIGMVNLEAALCNTPSITTFETGLTDWEKGGGVLVHPEISHLTEALLKVSQWSNEERIERGRKSFDFVKKNYSWGSTFPRWKELYTRVIKDEVL